MSWQELRASDGHLFKAYHREPLGERRGGLLLIQEIFGINSHVQAVAQGYAADGYEVLAPALYDRLERGVELGYQAEDVSKGRALRTALGWESPFLDLGAATNFLAARGPVVSLGYCWGGSLAWLSAARLPMAGAVVYYGAQIPDWLSEAPRAPVLAHFGARDPLIPPEKVDALQKAHPSVAIHRYAAGHGFNCDQRGDYDAAAARLARTRTLGFLRAVL